MSGATRTASRTLFGIAVIAFAFAGHARGQTANQTFHVLEATIADVQAELKSGRLTCRALVESYLKRIEAYDQKGPQLNAVQTVNPQARVEADRLDAAFRTSGP